MTHATVSTKGWVVIPKELRRKYGLKPGRLVEIVDYGGILGIVPVAANPVEALSGMFAGLGGEPWTETLLDEHRLDPGGKGGVVTSDQLA